MIHNIRKVSLAVGGSVLLIIACGFSSKRRRKMKKVEMERAKINIDQATNALKTITEAVKDKGENTMTRMEKEEFIERIKGMSQEELELVVEIIPVDMCMARVNKELDRLKAFENSVKSAVNGK